jgi:hypothetical protein
MTHTATNKPNVMMSTCISISVFPLSPADGKAIFGAARPLRRRDGRFVRAFFDTDGRTAYAATPRRQPACATARGK